MTSSNESRAGHGAEWIRLRETGVEIRVRLSPRASREGVHGLYGDRVKIRLTAPPVGGAANDALIGLLAKAAGVAASKIRIVAGLRDRSKTVLIECLEPARTAAKLHRHVAAAIDKPASRT